MADVLDPIDLTLIDPAVSAGNDFFRHANGGWLDANPVPPEYGSWGAAREVHERGQAIIHDLLTAASDAPGDPGSAGRMAGDYFAAGMDEAAILAAGTEPIRPLLERIDAVDGLATARGVIADLLRTGVGVLHGLGVAPDFDRPDIYLAYVGQGGLGLPERDYYLRDDERSVSIREAYQAHIAAQLMALGAEATAAAASATAILAFEHRLAEASLPIEQMRDVELTTNRHAVAELDELMPGFGLSGHVQALGATTESVNIDVPDFFRALDTTLAETPVEVLRDYLRWHLVRATASALPPVFEDEAFAFYGRILGGQEVQQPRWKRILEAAAEDIGEQVARLYVEAAFSAEAKARCEAMVEGLLHAMGRAIRRASWMTEATRTEALAKLASFRYKIGYPDTWRDYTGLAIERGPYVVNRLRSAAFEHDRQIGRLGQPIDATEWELPAHVVNAYYHPLLNEIVFTAGILQPPFFFADADDAVNYGGIGTVIGHEITHGFDDQGSHFDAEGRLRDWWTPEDRAEFERRAKVLVEQADRFEVADGATINGRLTLGENIADLGGLAIALDALHEAVPDAPLVGGRTADERFFLSYATIWRTNYTESYLRLMVSTNPHAPAAFRVNGPVANLPGFAAAFDLPAGSAMVRPDAERASIW